MPSIPCVSFAQAETTIASGTLDAAVAPKGHERTLAEQKLDDRLIAPNAVVAPVPVGHSTTLTSQVVDKKASFFQRHLGFDKWFHFRRVDKRAPQQAVVTDTLLWPQNQSSAARTFEIVGNVANGTNIDVHPWAVTVKNVPAANSVAKQMEAKMTAVDNGLPGALQQAAAKIPSSS